MIERFVQLSRQGLVLEEKIRDVGERVNELREDLRDVDDKPDPFIKEQWRLKRDLRDVPESLAPQN